MTQKREAHIKREACGSGGGSNFQSLGFYIYQALQLQSDPFYETCVGVHDATPFNIMVILSCAPNYVCLDFGGMSLSCLLYYPLSLHSTNCYQKIYSNIALTPPSCHSLYTALFQSFAWHCFIWDILQGWNIFCNLLKQKKKKEEQGIYFFQLQEISLFQMGLS